MPKYILSPDGSVKNRDTDKTKDITDLSREKVVEAGSFYSKNRKSPDATMDIGILVDDKFVGSVNLDNIRATDSKKHVIEKENVSKVTKGHYKVGQPYVINNIQYTIDLYLHDLTYICYL